MGFPGRVSNDYMRFTSYMATFASSTIEAQVKTLQAFAARPSFALSQSRCKAVWHPLDIHPKGSEGIGASISGAKSLRSLYIFLKKPLECNNPCWFPCNDIWCTPLRPLGDTCRDPQYSHYMEKLILSTRAHPAAALCILHDILLFGGFTAC